MAHARSSVLHALVAAGLAGAVGLPIAAATAPTTAPTTGSPTLQTAAATASAASPDDLRRESARAAEVRAARERASRSRREAADPRGVARALLADRGQADQFGCLDQLWTSESQWQVTADNPTSSAYGIPQALPGSKMASAGADWQTNPRTQISWGLSYIEASYGSPCGAWQFWQAHHWY